MRGGGEQQGKAAVEGRVDGRGDPYGCSHVVVLKKLCAMRGSGLGRFDRALLKVVLSSNGCSEASAGLTCA